MLLTVARGPSPSSDRDASLPNHTGVVYGPLVTDTAPVTAAPALHATVGGRRPCVRPGCGRMATSTLRFDYGERTVMLDPLGPDSTPGTYDLCFAHAARSTPPTGWSLRDRAPSRAPAAESPPPVGPDRGQGVARLAAALSAVPRAVSEDAPDAAPVGTDRSVSERSPLDSLLRPTSATVRTVPLSERTPEVEVRPVPQSLRLAPDPTTTVWCADLLAGPERSTSSPAVPVSPMMPGPAGSPVSAAPGDAFTLFG
jgi:hypothetical protein